MADFGTGLFDDTLEPETAHRRPRKARKGPLERLVA